MFRASEVAYDLNVPLNRFFTIHFDKHLNGHSPQSFMNGLMEHARKWLQRRGIDVAYLYVLENGKTKGLHTHLLIHIPAGYQVDFKRAMRAWLPFKWTRESVNVQRVDYPPYGALNALSPVYGRLRYICKGIKPVEAVRGIKPKFQGVIIGQRYGISKFLRQAIII